jgi:hypothetical protein
MNPKPTRERLQYAQRNDKFLGNFHLAAIHAYDDFRKHEDKGFGLDSRVNGDLCVELLLI